MRFYLEHRRALAAYAIALTGGAADAHDLIQDVLLRLIRGGAAPQHPRAYILRCLRTAAADRRRVRRPEARGDAGPDPAFLDVGGADAEARELIGLLQTALRSLPAAQREVLVLRVYGELTFQEVADVLGRPFGTIASTYARGIEALRITLGLEVEDERRAH